MTRALAGLAARSVGVGVGETGKEASAVASAPGFSGAPLHSAGISSKGKPEQEITLPWRRERPFQTEGKINTIWLDLTPTNPGWPHLLV